MHKIICNQCSGVWYTEQSCTNNIKVCPYCGESIRRNIEITSFDTLEKVLYKAIRSSGSSAFDNPNQLISFMMDLAPDMKKEIRILSKSLTAECLKAARSVFDSPLDSIEISISKLRYHLTEDEGLSDAWADLICSTYVGAINYLHGIGLGEVVTAQIEEVHLAEKLTEKKPLIVVSSPLISPPKATTKSSPRKPNTSKKNPVNKPDLTLCLEMLEKGKLYMAEKQYASAFAHLSKAAEGDLPEAKYELARCYYEGLGTPEDISKANELLHTVANQGFVPAWHSIAKQYFEQKNYKRAWKWYLKLADSGDPDGQYYVGLFYLHGYHVTKSSHTALKAFEKAGALGSVDAWYEMGLIYNQDQNYTLAADAFEKAAISGHTNAMISLANAYQKGLGRDLDLSVAATWLQKAIDSGNTQAKKHLDICISQMSATQKLKWTFSSRK